MDARLVLQIGIGAPITVVLSKVQSVTLGRNPKNHLVIQDEHASRYHAEVYFKSGFYHLKNLSQKNGTTVNGERIMDTVQLISPARINIGDSLIVYEKIPEGKEDNNGTLAEIELLETPVKVLPEDIVESPSTQFMLDELAILFSFVSESVLEDNPRELVGKALAVLLKNSVAEKVGFISLDEEEFIPKQVLPIEASLDFELSKTLTIEAKRRQKNIWLLEEQVLAESESLQSLRDAVCLLLQVKSIKDGDVHILGAIHLYSSKRLFNKKEVRFGKCLVDCLANGLYMLRLRRALEADSTRLKTILGNDKNLIVGSSAAIKKVKLEIQRIAPRKATVLITGESGVGKELVALELHNKSSRNQGPMVSVNCATITPGLADAELFGHMQGAFTGANKSTPGYFQRADEGTLFLDEIGELSFECQSKLLRVLETGKVRPLRGDESEVDVRVIAATNRNLEEEVAAGRFRKDLFYRLNVCCIRVPPLREHLEDLPELVDFFLVKFSGEYHKQFLASPDVLIKLQKYAWPGNIRQLKSVLECSVNQASSTTIQAQDVDIPSIDKIQMEDLPETLEKLELWAIKNALKKTGGNQTQAAKLLGIHRETLMLKLKKDEKDK